MVICSPVSCSSPILFLKCITLATFWQNAGSLIVAQYILTSSWTWVGVGLSSWRWNLDILRVVGTSGQLWLSGNCSDFCCSGSCVACSLVCPFSFSVACFHVHGAQLCLLRGFVLGRAYWLSLLCLGPRGSLALLEESWLHTHLGNMLRKPRSEEIVASWI